MILVISAVGISVPSIFCILKFLLTQVYLRSGTLIDLLLWLYSFLIPFVQTTPIKRQFKIPSWVKLNWFARVQIKFLILILIHGLGFPRLVEKMFDEIFAEMYFSCRQVELHHSLYAYNNFCLLSWL